MLKEPVPKDNVANTLIIVCQEVKVVTTPISAEVIKRVNRGRVIILIPFEKKLAK